MIIDLVTKFLKLELDLKLNIGVCKRVLRGSHSLNK